MGKPGRPAGKRYTERQIVYLTPEENEQLLAYCERLGISVSSFCRLQIMRTVYEGTDQ